MTEQPKMTLPNGDVLVEGDWGVTREGSVVRVRFDPTALAFPWVSDVDDGNGWTTYQTNGRYSRGGTNRLDIIARARTSTRPADEMDLTALCKPFGLLHPDTQAALTEWPHGSELFNGEWRGSMGNYPLQTLAYRAKPAPVAIRATIPWEILRPEIKWVAQDENGDWYGFGDSVRISENKWLDGDDLYSLYSLTFPQGDEHWTNTLQQRPQAGDKQGGGNV